MNATIIMISQAATALGGVVWGSAAASTGVVPTFVVAGVLAIVVVAFTQLGLRKRLSVDFTASLNLEPAALTVFSHKLDPMRLAQVKDNPVSVVTEFEIDPADRDQCMRLMREIRLIYLRNGARNWRLYEDFLRLNRFQMEVIAPSWSEYQRLNERLTMDEREVLDSFHNLCIDRNPRVEFVRVSVNKDIIKGP